MHTMDSNFVAEEMELYDEIRSTLDEDELLIIMSRLQEHFLEKLAHQNEQRRLREEELKQFQQTSDTEGGFTEITETEYTTFDEDFGAATEDDTTAPSTPKSIISSTSRRSDTSPVSTFAYPDDPSNPFGLPPRDPSRNRNGSASSFKSNKSNKSSKSDGKRVFFAGPNFSGNNFNGPGLTSQRLQTHNAQQKANKTKTGLNTTNYLSQSVTELINQRSGPLTASSMISNGSGKPNMIMTHPPRPITPNNSKFTLKNRQKRGQSEIAYKRTNSNESRHSNNGKIVSRLKAIPQSISNPSSPHKRADTYTQTQLMTPQVNAGAYRLDLFCDIKFVKNIFVRWISCKNEVLCHVASRTLGILFSHSYLTADQFLDLAELLLGVHDEKNNVFGNMEVTQRPNRPGLFFAGDVDSSSSPYDSDFSDSPDEIIMSDDSDDIEDLLDNSDEFKLKDKDKMKVEKKDDDIQNTPEPASKPNGARDSDDENEDNNQQDKPDIDINKQNEKPSKPPTLDVLEEEAQFSRKGTDTITIEESTPKVNENDKNFLRNGGRRMSVASSASSGSRSSRRSRIHKLPYDVHWDNRLYCAMKVLSYIVSNPEVYEGCVVALDEWFSIIAIELFRRARKAGIGVLEGFLHLIKKILVRFADNKDVMGQCKLSQVLADDANSELLDIITSGTSTLVTRASALELCPLLMVTSEVGSKKFAHHCLVSVLDDGRFNPFEPGDITMSRTFQRGEAGQLRTINEKNPLEKNETVANYIPHLLFQRISGVFVDQESVQRLTFLCVIKAMNIVSQKIMAIEDEDRKEKEKQEEAKREKEKDKEQDKNDDGPFGPTIKKKKKKKKRRNDDFDDDMTGTVDKLAGEFDASTARKIRNFFSRDADYTRYRILELVEEEDDVLIEVLLELLLIESALRKSKSRLAVRIRYLFDPFMLFYDFIDCTDADYQFLLDFLISGETVFLEYLLKFCKRMQANWNPTNATKDEVNRVMSILIRLRMHVSDLYQKGSFPYSPKALLKAMEKVEFCYENEKGQFESQASKNMFDLDYMNYVKKKKIKEQQKEEQEKLKRISKKSQKPKKMMISSLFLQDVKQQKEMEKRNSEIAKGRKEALAKRAKKKKSSKKSKTKRKGSDDMLPDIKPPLHREKSMATHIMKKNQWQHIL